jgi:hypothetical protein
VCLHVCGREENKLYRGHYESIWDSGQHSKERGMSSRGSPDWFE